MSDIATKLVTMADNTPAVAEACNAAKATASGATIRVDDVLSTEHPLQVQTTAGAKVTVTGKNLLSVLTKYDGKTPAYNAQPIYMKKGERYTFSHDGDYTTWRLMFYGMTPDGQPFPYNAQPGGSQDEFKYMASMYTAAVGRLQHSANLTGRSVVLICNSDCIITAVQFWVTGTENKAFTQYQLEDGTAVTEYEPYKASQIATADNTGNVEGLRSVSPTMTMMIDHGAEVQCTYFPQSAADTYAKYQELKTEQSALQEKLQEYLLEESTNE